MFVWISQNESCNATIVPDILMVGFVSGYSALAFPSQYVLSVIGDEHV